MFLTKPLRILIGPLTSQGEVLKTHRDNDTSCRVSQRESGIKMRETMAEAVKKQTANEVSQRVVPTFSNSIAMLRLTHNGCNLIGGKPDNRIPQFKKKSKTKHIRLT